MRREEEAEKKKLADQAAAEKELQELGANFPAILPEN